MWPSRHHAVLTAFAYAAAEREQAAYQLVEALSKGKDED